jgi:hypothetical protein
MRRWRIAGVAAGLAVLMLGGCTNLERAQSYGSGSPDAIYSVQGQQFELHVHGSDPTLLLRVSLGNGMMQAAVRGATFGFVETAPPFERWKAAAQWLVQPVGCAVEDLRPLFMETTWEFTYRCPPGVDLRARMRAQRDQLRNGVQLTP